MPGPAADPPFYPDRLDLLTYADAAGKRRPVKTPADRGKRRAHVLAGMELVMGPLPDAGRKVPADLKVEGETDGGGHVRRKVSFAAEKGDRVTAYLLVPKGPKGKVGAVLCLHQTVHTGKDEPAGLWGSKNLHYARELADRGYVCLAPDYPGFGGYNPDAYALGYASVTMKGVWNHVRAVDLLQALPEVDGGRIGVIGHSLGGHNALFVAAFDPRIEAAVSSCGFTSFPKHLGGGLKVWAQRKYYMPRVASAYGNDPKKVPFDFPEVLGAVAPRAVFVNAPAKDYFDLSGVKDCVAAAGRCTGCSAGGGSWWPPTRTAGTTSRRRCGSRRTGSSTGNWPPSDPDPSWSMVLVLHRPRVPAPAGVALPLAAAADRGGPPGGAHPLGLAAGTVRCRGVSEGKRAPFRPMSTGRAGT